MVEVYGASVKSEGDENIWEAVSMIKSYSYCYSAEKDNWEYISAILRNSQMCSPRFTISQIRNIPLTCTARLN